MTELVPEIVEERHLSAREEGRLQELEGVIEANFKGFVAVGMALSEIREDRLYRRQYRTFEEYCVNLWDVKKSQAYNLINASVVVQNLSTIVDKNNNTDAKNTPEILLPSNEAQARELAKLPPEEQVYVWERTVNLANNTKTKITAKSVKQMVRFHRGEELDKEIKKGKEDIRKSRENRSDFQSDDFTAAFDQFFDQVRIEKEANWRNTSRKTVYRILAGILDMVSLAVPGTMEEYGCVLELSEREKLKKGGFRIFRMDTKYCLIEEWVKRDQWTTFLQCENPKHLSDEFKSIMESHTCLKG